MKGLIGRKNAGASLLLAFFHNLVLQGIMRPGVECISQGNILYTNNRYPGTQRLRLVLEQNGGAACEKDSGGKRGEPLSEIFRSAGYSVMV